MLVLPTPILPRHLRAVWRSWRPPSSSLPTWRSPRQILTAHLAIFALIFVLLLEGLRVVCFASEALISEYRSVWQSVIDGIFHVDACIRREVASAFHGEVYAEVARSLGMFDRSIDAVTCF